MPLVVGGCCTSSRLAAVSKTVLFSRISKGVSQRGRTVGIFAHRVELLDQISNTLAMFGVEHGVIAAGAKYVEGHSVYVVSAHTYSRRLAKMPVFNVGVIDEAHHVTPDNTWGRCVGHSPDAVWLGVTATPERLDGKGLGKSFEVMVQGPTTKQLIADGYLARFRAFAPPCSVDFSKLKTVAGDYDLSQLSEAVDRPSITGDAVTHYQRHLDFKPAIAFCVSVLHAQHVASAFRSAGYRAESIDGSMDKATRKRLMEDFRAGRLHVLSSCELISEGLDVPGIHGVILLRPTQSLGLYMQQVGRSLRPCEGKEAAIILDHAGNTARHGLPSKIHGWTLGGRDKKKKGDSEETIKQCSKCYAAYESILRACPECGHVEVAIVDRAEELDYRAGDLVEVEEVEQPKYERGKMRTTEELIAFGVARGMKNPAGWAWHIQQARRGGRH